MLNNQENVLDQILNLIGGKFYGKYSGEVMDNEDPFDRGRLEVSVPSLLRSEKFWAMPCLPFGGKEMGLFMVPEIGTGVWVEFEGGDLNHPIWTGCYWRDDESPKDKKSNKPDVRLIKSKTGLTISLDDAEEILTIRDKDDTNTIIIDVTKGQIKIKAGVSVVVEAPSVKLGGEEAFQPVVKGIDLLAYLNALVLAAKPKTGLIIPPPLPSLLSQKVKTT